MEFATKAALINIFGDEWGAGEAWDLYEMYTNYHQFKKTIIYIIGGFLLAVGIISLVMGLYENNNEILLFMGGGFIGIGIVMFVIALVHTYNHSHKTGAITSISNDILGKNNFATNMLGKVNSYGHSYGVDLNL